MPKQSGNALVWVEGFEPPTTRSQAGSATKLRYTQTKCDRPDYPFGRTPWVLIIRAEPFWGWATILHQLLLT